MADSQELVNSVKSSIANGSATTTTLTTLQTLLGLSPSTKAEPSTTKPTASRAARKPVPAKNAKPLKSALKTSKKNATVRVLEDEPKALQPQARFALATDVVNSTLKILTDASKSVSRPQTVASPKQNGSADGDATPQRHPALQVRSANATPVRKSPTKTGGPKEPLEQAKEHRDPDWTPTAECARLAFSHLRSVDAAKLGVKGRPNGQLEQAMLALCGRLINLGLENLATKELHAVKKRLERANVKIASSQAGASERETLPSLLNLRVDFEIESPALPIAIAHQAHVLQLIANSQKPRTIEESVQYLSLDRKGSPGNLILVQAQDVKNHAKVGSQLDMLFQTIMRMCPPVSTAADEFARDAGKSISPLTAFQLQVIALQVRVQALRYKEKSQGQEKDVVGPLSRCFDALLRRLPLNVAQDEVFGVCEAAWNVFGLGEISDQEDQSRFTIYRTLSILAERVGLKEKAQGYAQSAFETCSALDPDHARRVAAVTRRVAALLSLPDQTSEELCSVHQSLGRSLSGSTQDHELLLGELSHLAARLNKSESQSEDSKDFNDQCIRSIARFASRYARICPGKQAALVRQTIDTALCRSKTRDDLISWINDDTARALIQAGSLRSVVESMAHQPTTSAWTFSTSAMALGRILRGLVLKSIVSGSGSLYDDGTLDAEQQGAVLEWQLHFALELAHKSKYGEALSKLIPDLLRRLSKAYSPTEYPLRRARTAALALRTRAAHPGLIPPHTLQVFKGVARLDPDDLAKDYGLRPFVEDIEASKTVAEAFDNQRPTLKNLRPSMLIWQRILDKASSSSMLGKVLDSPDTTLVQLIALEDYFATLGDDVARLSLARMICQLQNLLRAKDDAQCFGSLRMASAFSSLGYAEKAESALIRADLLLKHAPSTTLENLEYYILHAEYLLSVDNVTACEASLQKAADARSELQPASLRSNQVRVYRLLHCRGWLIQSRYLITAGLPHEALLAAKRAVNIANNIWVGLEKSDQHSQTNLVQIASEPERPIDTLTRGVSKLNLKPDFEKSSTGKECKAASKGAVFWSLVPIMCQALTHLADLYAHHGNFNEANYFCQRAVQIAEAVGSQELLSRVRYNRGVLLACAGKNEDAELCLAHEQDENMQLAPLTKVQQLRAKATLLVKYSDMQGAYKCLEKAESIAKQIQSDAYVASLERLQDDEAPSANPPAPAEKTKVAKTDTWPTVASKRAAPTKNASKAPRVVGRQRPAKTSEAQVAKESTAWGSCYVLQKLEGHILLHKGVLSCKLGLDDTTALTWLSDLSKIFPDAFIRRQFNHMLSMQKANAALSVDFSFNALPESTLSIPALQISADVQSAASVPPAISRKTVVKNARVVKGAKKAVPEKATLSTLLLAARKCLTPDGSDATVLSTSDTHKLYSLLSKTSITLSATSSLEACSMLRPSQEALCVDLPRISAKKCSEVAAKLDIGVQKTSDLLTWPESVQRTAHTSITAETFQRDYINILPKPWIAVSLGLNEECDELYITRYRQGLTPLILRLPFSRQKAEDADEEIFDFHVGREELREIIDLSNYSCHNPMDISVKGAKTNWWSERESLDRRLQELLINIENIWLGGFRGILSQHERDQPELDRFRKAFDATLDRHLPSRRNRSSKRLALDDQILELFVGLGDDKEGEVDLDDALADLLYFVVDMLQFNGERNAYDEIDFDSMAVEVLDALREYFDSASGQDEAAHLILILDRRLQAFPWESLPYLETSSVSRVDSMLTLRERIVAMKAENQPLGYHEVSRHSGAYIVNPAGDLASTEKNLVPHLATLKTPSGDPWTSIVNRVPTEDVFSAALQASSQLLYFGHGSGLQYIRPRVIRRLEKCSEVVWLMGCSSGAATEFDELEPFSVPLTYLQAGSEGKGHCMAILSTLWDVTDKDIDRFSLAVGQEWGLWEGEATSTLAPTKTPRKRATTAHPATPEKAAKTPVKTPKVKKTPANVNARTPARSRSRSVRERDGDGKKQSLVQAVARSRDACYLRYLNGAAVVVYGVPVYLGD